MTRHPRIVVRAVTWNLFHGRDDPAPGQVNLNRPLRSEFAERLAAMTWEVALLQEVPPGWLRHLCKASAASGVSALTSRNFLHLARAALAWLSPDLMGSWEGGSNQVLVRPPWRITEVGRRTTATRPERRRMLLVRLADAAGRELVVANVHLSTGGHVDEVLAAAERAVDWSRRAPLVFGGDLNLRPQRAPDAFAALEQRYGLTGPTAPDAIDHLLSRGLALIDPSRPLPSAMREVSGPTGSLVRLSDHSPVAAAFEME